jgi:hypothetical protein
MGDAVSIRAGGTGDREPLPGVFVLGGGGGPSGLPAPCYQHGRIPDRPAGALRCLPHTLGQDIGLPAGPGYELAGGLGPPNADHPRRFATHG